MAGAVCQHPGHPSPMLSFASPLRSANASLHTHTGTLGDVYCGGRLWMARRGRQRGRRLRQARLNEQWPLPSQEQKAGPFSGAGGELVNPSQAS